MNSICHARDAQDALVRKGSGVRKLWSEHWGQTTWYLGRTRQHTLARIETGTAGILNLLDFGTAFSDDRSHPRVRYHELDSHSSATRDRGLIKRLVVDPTYDQSKCLYAAKCA